ncbi:MAG: IPT/TIG domain-containing protein [Candidatus Nomurabacteria bacterium]|nr:IPT/TIG domain-containing protein [Candidatus Nomurabacteria bacterium]
MICQWVALQSLDGAASYEEVKSHGITLAVVAGEGIDVTLDNDVCQLPLEPSPVGFMANCQFIANVKTNNSDGYTIHFSADNDTACATFVDTCLTGLGSATGHFITPAIGDFDNPQTLANNTWGFALPESEVSRDSTPANTFDVAYTVDAANVGNTAKQDFLNAPYARVPVLSSAVKIRDTTIATPTDGDIIHILLAARADFGIRAGNYIGTLRLTVTAKIPPLPIPEVHTISPSSQSDVTAHQTVTITGAGFMKDDGTSLVVHGVTIGGQYCTDINVISATSLTCLAPAQATAGSYAVQIKTTGGQSNTNITYTYINNQIIQDGSNIQDVTLAMCSNASISTATNPVISVVKDERDGHYYAIAKMADNKCWMLTNLAYSESTSGITTYSAGIEFTSGAGTTSTYCTPSATAWCREAAPSAKQWVDPSSTTVTSSSRCASAYSTSITLTYAECGYLYNWCAALGTASAKCSASSGNVSEAGVELCPANWRLPTGGSSGEFSYLNGMMAGDGGASTTNDQAHGENWISSGAWRGYYAGYFLPGTGMTSRGEAGLHWSATAYSASDGYGITFSRYGINVRFDTAKYYGLAVRCILYQ